ncbi:MAG: isochorismatase family cysteine hydrolase [Dehalococcoidia bacterium]|nr:isochorismatase family cysteine hydrolase [Dehalococcoidia bacterium]
MTSAVLVADMIRGFCEPGRPLYVGDTIRAIIPGIQRLLDMELRRGSKVFYLCDNHVPDDPEFRMFPAHCLEGTAETEVIPELAAYPGDIIRKARYSAFYGTALEQKLKDLTPDRLLVCGDCTSICVLFTVADAVNRGYPVDVVRDCVADFDQEAHAFALRHMERVLGARLITSEGPRN